MAKYCLYFSSASLYRYETNVPDCGRSKLNLRKATFNFLSITTALPRHFRVRLTLVILQTATYISS